MDVLSRERRQRYGGLTAIGRRGSSAPPFLALTQASRFSVHDEHPRAALCANAMRRTFAVRRTPAHPSGEFVCFSSILMLDRQRAADHVEKVPLRAPMVGEIAGMVVDDAHLNVVHAYRPNARFAGLSRRCYRFDPRPVDSCLRQIRELHGRSRFSSRVDWLCLTDGALRSSAQSKRKEQLSLQSFAWHGLHTWYVIHMTHISIRDLQRISSETIGALPGPTAVKSGERTVGLLVPLKAADPDRLASVLARAEALARGRDPVDDDMALAPFGPVDPTDYSLEEARKLLLAPAEE